MVRCWLVSQDRLGLAFDDFGYPTEPFFLFSSGFLSSHAVRSQGGFVCVSGSSFFSVVRRWGAE